MKDTEAPIIKRGKLYDDIKNQIKPLDLIAFRGDTIYSHLIREFENHGKFTHVGIVVTSDVLDEHLLKPGKLYLLESTISGIFDYDVYNIYGQSYAGVQICDLDNIVNAYDKPNDTVVAWCPLINNPWKKSSTKRKLTKIYNKINGKMYNLNIWNLLSTVYPFMRPLRSLVDHIFHTEEWLFCSEMVALVYNSLNILSPNINSRDVTPDDLIYPEADIDRIPKIINNINYITTPSHYPDVDNKTVECECSVKEKHKTSKKRHHHKKDIVE